MNNWYAFRVQPGTELKAQALLTGYGILGRNPVHYKYTRTNKDGSKVVEGLPTLRGYYIGQWLDNAADWYTIANLTYADGARVLRKALSWDGHIRPLDPLTRVQILNLQGVDLIAPEIEPQHGLKPGDTVVIKGGLHSGKRIVLQRVARNTDKAKTFTAVMDLLGGQREVELDERSLELVVAA